MSYASVHLMHTMLDALRYVLWVMVSGFAILGATFYGGMGVCAVWQKAGPPARRRRSDAAAIAKEAATGIVEIEAFLAEHSPPPDDARGHAPEPADAPPASRRPPVIPPASDEAA